MVENRRQLLKKVEKLRKKTFYGNRPNLAILKASYVMFGIKMIRKQKSSVNDYLYYQAISS